jgi:thiosulfate/3-mercaptopyruvate sulfurtransferase
MSRYKFVLSISFIILFLAIVSFSNNQTEPWRLDQLMEPAQLAAVINEPRSPQPLIISVGPGGLIKNSIDVGSVKEKENLNKLKALLTKQPKDKAIVIYCGCCPFHNCPNIRPAFNLLNEMKFTNHKLLNLPHNIKADWLNKDFPVSDNN